MYMLHLAASKLNDFTVTKTLLIKKIMPNVLHNNYIVDNQIKYNVDRRQMYNQPNYFHKLKMFFLNFGVQKHKRFYFISFDIDMEVEDSGHVLLMQYS